MKIVLALSAAIGASAATGDATALCTDLLTGKCASYAQFPAPLPTVAQCVTAITAAVPSNGQDTDTSGDTIGCRQYYANKGGTWCQFAGYTGGGLCGIPVATTCNAIHAHCNGVTGYSYQTGGTTACQANLTATLQAVWGSKQGLAAASENSLECRVYHSIVGWNNGAANAGSQVHCTHVTTGGAGWCDSNTVTSSVDHYCNQIVTSCNQTTGGTSRRQYNDIPQCLASFPSFVDGNVNPSNAANDRGCRQYHANAAIALADLSHCHHGGPSGGGVCGNSTVAWQSMGQVASCANNATYAYVKASINLAFTAWNRSDLVAIVPVGADLATFGTGSAGDTDTCRLYHLTVASVDATHCGHGAILNDKDGACGTMQAAACRMFQTACGTTAFADATTCTTAIKALIDGNKTGVPSATPTTTDDLACRVYQGGLALASKNMGNAAAAVTAACAGVKSPGSTICGGSTVKSGASSVAASVLLALVPVFLL